MRGGKDREEQRNEELKVDSNERGKFRDRLDSIVRVGRLLAPARAVRLQILRFPFGTNCAIDHSPSLPLLFLQRQSILLAIRVIKSAITRAGIICPSYVRNCQDQHPELELPVKSVAQSVHEKPCSMRVISRLC